MGLCKCPKKKVTNLFCFEHRVNVCEHCLVANHKKCIVQSHLQWLQDSDYDPTCRLCGIDLNGNETEDCVRLACYDVFHWKCFDKYAQSMPPNTAPAGYTCPICNAGIFPAPNVASPVAVELKAYFEQVNWARTGLGLPMIDASPEPTEEIVKVEVKAKNTHSELPRDPMVHSSVVTAPVVRETSSPIMSNFVNTSSSSTLNHSTILNLEDSSPYTRGTENITSRKSSDKEPLLSNGYNDHDLDKYKRRPAMQWFSKWFDSHSNRKYPDPNAELKRIVVIIILGILAFFTLIIVFTSMGKAATENDPFLDPRANPNIRVADN